MVFNWFHNHNPIAAITVFLLFTFTGISSVYALDANAVAKRFGEAFGTSVKVSMDGIEQNDNTILLKNVHIAGHVLSLDTKLGNVELSGVQMTAHGGFKAKVVKIPAIDYRYESSRIQVKGALLGEVDFPPNKGLYNQNIGYRYKIGRFDQIDLIDYRKKTLGSLASGQITLTHSIRDNPVGFNISIPKVTVEVANFPAGSSRTDFINMGYAKATGSLQLSGLYGGKNALMQLDHFDVVLNNGGKLGINIKMDGISVDSLMTIVTLQRENEHGKIDKSRMFMGMLGQVQRYNFHQGGLHFTDNGLTAKIIRAEAKRVNKTPDAIRKQWKEGLPGWLSFTKNTDFFAKATKQIQIFVDNPKTLTLTSKPMNRLPIIMLAVSGKLNPDSLVRQLKLYIVANR